MIKILVVIFNDNDTEDDIKYFMSKLSERIIDLLIVIYKKIVNKFANKTYNFYINIFKLIDKNFDYHLSNRKLQLS